MSSHSPTSYEKRRFHFLDGLRGIASFLVIFRHIPDPFRPIWDVRVSYLAVDFFFCLSGFVIAYSYEPRLRASLSFRDFAVARIIRLYPMAFIGSLIGLLGLFLSHAFHLEEALTITQIIERAIVGLVMLPWMVTHQSLYPLDPVLWSLMDEAVANLVYGLAVRRGWERTRNLAIVAMVAVVPITALIMKNTFIDHGFTFGSSSVGLIRVAFSFAVGVLLCRLFNHRARAPLGPVASILVAALCLAAVVGVLCNTTPIAAHAVFNLAAIVLVFPLIVFGGAYVNLPPILTKLSVVSGEISYPLYTLHPVFYWPLFLPALHAPAFVNAPSTKWLLLAYGFTIVLISWLTAKFLELPMRGALTTWYKRHRDAPSAAQPI